jgi:iron complex outermembrane receptor protein
MKSKGCIQRDRASIGERRGPALGWLLTTIAPIALGAAGPALAEGSPDSRHAIDRTHFDLAQGTLAQAEQHVFDIPAQPLASALTAFGQQSGLQVTFAPAMASGRRSSAVSGSLAPEEALRRILAGTGVTYRFVDGRTVALEIAADAKTGSVVTLPPVTVIGTREANVPLSNVPASVTVVPREEIEKEQITAPRIEDIISRTVPGFNPTNNGVRQIRGRTAQVFLNGTPLNEQLRASSGSDLNVLPPDHLDKIEVSRGANSAYGFGSPGGIIALSTPRAESEELTLTTKLRGSFNPHEPGGSYQTTLYQGASQIVGKLDYHLGGSVGYDGLEFDADGNRALGFESPNGLTNAREGIGALDGSFGYDLGESGKLRLTAAASYTNVLRGYEIDGLGTYRQVQSSIVRFPPADDSYRRAGALNGSYENADIWGSAVKLELLASKVDTTAYRSEFGTGRALRDEQTNEYQGFRSSITTPLSGVYEGLSFTYGFDALRNRYFRPVYFSDNGALESFVSPDVTLDSYAPYVQVNMPVGPFLLSGGVRHEEYRGSAETATGPGGIQGGDIRPFDLTLYNAGIVYPLTDAIDLFGSFTQGAEITQLGRAARDAGMADQIDPRPAKSNQYEIGLRKLKSSLRYGVSAFYTESDLLSALQCDGINPCTPLREPRKFWGIEGSLNWQIDRQWGIGGVVTWYEGTRETETGDTRRIGGSTVPPLLTSAYVDYAPYEWWKNTVSIDYRGERDRFGDSTDFDEGRVDRVALLNYGAIFTVGRGEILFGVRNLLNKKYFSIPAEAGNGGFLWVPEEGTRVSLAYAIRW